MSKLVAAFILAAVLGYAGLQTVNAFAHISAQHHARMSQQ